MSSGKVLIDPSKTYRVIQNTTKKLIPIPGTRILTLIADAVKKVYETVQKQAQSAVQRDTLPNKTRRLNR